MVPSWAWLTGALMIMALLPGSGALPSTDPAEAVGLVSQSMELILLATIAMGDEVVLGLVSPAVFGSGFLAIDMVADAQPMYDEVPAIVNGQGSCVFAEFPLDADPVVVAMCLASMESDRLQALATAYADNGVAAVAAHAVMVVSSAQNAAGSIATISQRTGEDGLALTLDFLGLP